MTLAQGIVLGLVQGLTEFLPISSSAHLVLVPHFLGWEIPSVSFDVILHLGTLVAVISYFWGDLKNLPKNPSRRLIWLIFIAALPAGLIGYFFGEFFENLFKKPFLVAILLLITGVILWSSEILALPKRKLEKVNLADSIIIGLAQIVAIAPGISRSGITISAGIVKGLEKDAAARFSFLLAIPIIFGAALEKMRELTFNPLDFNLVIVISFLTAMVSGYLAIKYFLKHLRKGNLRIFAYYCWIFGGFALALSYFKQ